MKDDLLMESRCDRCTWDVHALCPGQRSRLSCVKTERKHIDPRPVSTLAFDLTRHAIYQRFGRKKRIKIKNGSILCASDSNQFVPLQLMLASLMLSHDVPIGLIDLGLQPGHRSWLIDQGVIVMDATAPMMPIHVNYWQSWNKPFYMDLALTDRFLWIDSDCVIDGDLRQMFAAIDDGPLIMRDSYTTEIDQVANKPEFYRYFPIKKSNRIMSLNAGVLGLHKSHDKTLIDTWKNTVCCAVNDKDLRSFVSWFDQGALVYACERLQVKITDRYEWNDERPEIRRYSIVYDNPQAMIEAMPTGSTILHYLGKEKPYGWKELPLSLKSAPNLSVFVLSHMDVDQPKREYVDYLNMDWFEPNNEWAESRVFDQIPADSLETDYIALCTYSWRKKYEQFGAWAPWELGTLKLEPNVVWVAQDTQDLTFYPSPDWVDHMEQASPGIRPFIDELRRVSGLIELKSSAWSNNYVLHRTLYAELGAFHRRMKSYFVSKYGHKALYKALDPARGYGYLAEAFSVHWLASRDDLIIRLIRRPGYPDRARIDARPLERAVTRPVSRPIRSAPGESHVIITREQPIACQYKGCSMGCKYYICKKYWFETDNDKCKRCIAAGNNR